MAVLDASALIALLRAEPGGSMVRQILQDADRSSGVSAINLAESVDVLVRVFDIDESDIADAFDLLELGDSPFSTWTARPPGEPGCSGPGIIERAPRRSRMPIRSPRSLRPLGWRPS